MICEKLTKCRVELQTHSEDSSYALIRCQILVLQDLLKYDCAHRDTLRAATTFNAGGDKKLEKLLADNFPAAWNSLDAILPKRVDDIPAPSKPISTTSLLL